MVMVSQLLLVSADLPIQFVHQLVDGRVQVLVRLFNEDVATLDVQRDLGLEPAFVPLARTVLRAPREEDAHIDDLVEMPRHSVQLTQHVLSKSRRYVEVVATDGEIHGSLQPVV